MNTWAIAIIPLVGVALGATLQFRLSRAAAREQHAESLRSQACSDYLRAVAAAAHLRSDEDLRDAHRDAPDAKSRIAVYGSADTISALSRFEEAGGVLVDGPAVEAFVTLVASMRPSGDSVPTRDLKTILLGTDQLHNVADDAPRRS